jgi:pyruvate dehydrogenase E2 component (dihydrolipoamide acetyltransferase)
MEVEALESGTIKALNAKPGEMIPVGASIAVIAPETSAEASSTAADKPKRRSASEQPYIPTNASPLAIILAEQHGINLKQVPGTGPNGRIMKEDVAAYVSSRKTDTETADSSMEKVEQPVATEEPVAEIPTALSAKKEPASNLSAVSPDLDLPTNGNVQQHELETLASPVIEMFSNSSNPAETHSESTLHSSSHVELHSDPINVIPAATASANSEIHLAVMVNMTALSQSIPVLTQRFSRAETERPEEALTPVYMRAAAIALRNHFQHTQTERSSSPSVGFSVSGDRDFIFCEVVDCATRPLSEIFQDYQDQRRGARAINSLANDTAGASIAILNLAQYGIEEYIGLGHLKYTALLSLGVTKESAVMNSGRVERAHLMKASMSIRTSAWTALNAVSFLSEFKQLLEHPVLLLGF